MVVIFRVIGLYVVVALAFTVMFIMMVRSGFAGDAPLFYRGVFFLGLTWLVVFALSIVFRAVSAGMTSVESLFSATVLALSVNFAFFVIIPVTIDRSVTTFLLSSMDSEGPTGGGYSKADLQQILKSNYLGKFDAVGRRLDEQILSGNISETSVGVYELTEQAQSFLRFAQFIARVYAIQDRYIAAANYSTSN